MSEQTTMAPEQDPLPVYGIFIALEPAEGGAIMQMSHPGGKKNAIISGDPESPAFQRKVQRRAVKWCKEFFTAPPRKKKEATPEA